MDETTATIQLTLKQLHNSGFNIAFQWVPSHVELLGNSEADKLAGAAHGLPRTIPSPTDFKATRKFIKSYITELSPTTYSKHQPCVTKGLTRKKNTLLIRIRSRGAFTNAFLFKISAIKSFQCPNCNDEENIFHILFNCEEYCDPHHRFVTELARIGLRDPDDKDIIYPSGSARRRQIIQHLLLNFLDESGVSDRL